MTAPRILVVGDVMLDRYWHGDVTRISPEAPVPVVKVTRVEDRLGGAANVARNVVALGGEAELMGIVGVDQPGQAVAALGRAAGIIMSTTPGDNTTTMKLRTVCRGQQIARQDFELPPSDRDLEFLLERFERDVCDADVVVLSDYAKGTLRDCQEMIQIARRAGKPLLVDPKGKDWNKYHGATLIKPNLAELQAVVGEVTRQSMHTLRHALEVDAVLVTEGEAGMTLYWDGEPMHQRAYAREVFDVTGAGDTVIAAMAVAYKANHAWQRDMRFASAAAGIVVGKTGTAVATANEVEAVLHG